MPTVKGRGNKTLTDLNDAIVSGSAPLNPTDGTLWIDESVNPNVVKRWQTGAGWVVIGEIMDEGTGTTIGNIQTTLGNITDDNKVDYTERQYVKDRLTEIIGYIQPDNAVTLPTTITLDSGSTTVNGLTVSTKGTFYNARKSATNAGISSSDTGIAFGVTTYGTVYDTIVTKYNALKTYLEGLTPIDVWDTSTANKDNTITVTKDTWRTKWLEYYQAEYDLVTAVAKKLKDDTGGLDTRLTTVERNTSSSAIVDTVRSSSEYAFDFTVVNDKIDGITMGGRNYILNSAFYRILDNWYPIDYLIDDEHLIDGDATFEENDDIEIFLQDFFGEDSGDFEDNVNTIFESTKRKHWLHMKGSSESLYKGVYQNINLENGKDYILSFKGFKGQASSTSILKIYIDDILIDTFNLTNYDELYVKKFNHTGDSSVEFKLIGDTSSSYEIFVTEIKLEEGNLNPTDWTSAPEDEMANYETLTLLETRVSSAEQKITSDSIVSTVTSSTSFGNIMSGKADASSLSGLASKGELDTLSGSIDGKVDAKINALNLGSTYATKNELTQTSKDLTARLSATGGMNLLKNSIGFADFITKTDADGGKKNWFRQGTTSRVMQIQNGELDTLGFSSGFQFSLGTSGQWASIDQYVSVIPNQDYTLSWYLKKTNNSASNGSVDIYAYEYGTTNKIPVTYLDTDGITEIQDTQYRYATTTVTNGYEAFHMKLTPTTSQIQIRIYGWENAVFIVSGLMLTIGDVALQWSLATGETFNTNVRLDINGIRVSQLNVDRKEVGYTQITPDEFAGYWDSDGDGTFEKVFYLNGDETVTKKLKALNEITMGNLKIININQSGNNGWAFVPIT
jgi:hypothetical protein